jgi:alpha-galactosidase
MKKTADKIKKEGFIPGIWTGPYLQSTYGEVARNHPEWLISNKKDGRPICFTAPFLEVLYLDPTHPGAQKFLKELYERLYADGYRYFKIDFLNNIVSTIEKLGGNLYDSTVSPLEAIKMGVKIIRKAVKNSILVGCGGFIPEVGTGLFDSCRASHDISSYWSNNLAISRNIAFKSIFDRNCWENDYDFLIVRGKETSTNNQINAFKRLETFVPHTPYEPFKLRRGDTIQTVGEARAWASLVLVSGTSVVLSDRIRELNKKGLNLTTKVLELAEGAKGVPLDLLDNPVASVWLARGEKKTILGVFNWTDKDAKINALKYLKKEGINIEKAKEVWTGKVDNLAKVAIPRRDAKIFIIEN